MRIQFTAPLRALALRDARTTISASRVNARPTTVDTGPVGVRAGEQLHAEFPLQGVNLLGQQKTGDVQGALPVRRPSAPASLSPP